MSAVQVDNVDGTLSATVTRSQPDMLLTVSATPEKEMDGPAARAVVLKCLAGPAMYDSLFSARETLSALREASEDETTRDTLAMHIASLDRSLAEAREGVMP